tara:strand:+ start:682 stop:1068 length:387 start_codon:yes stop_codon:yes gene_type:complete
MKITQSLIKQIILEESESDQALLDAINRLAGKIEDLDVSIDFLSAAVTGEDALSIGLSQKALGRVARPIQTRDRSKELEEVLDSDATVEDYIEDFKDSDAPQFKGKSKKKRREMAIAAALKEKENKET